MNPSTVNAILGVLERHPAGTTAKASAAELGWKETAASQRMGELFFAGTIARQPMPGRVNNVFLYRLKPVEAPPTAPEQWKPERTIIAQRRTDMVHVRIRTHA